MEFSPANNIVKLCLQGIGMDEQGDPEKAKNIFTQAWDMSTNDFEKFIAAFYVARHQGKTTDRLKWLGTTLQLALAINDETVHAALPGLYTDIARCNNALGDNVNARKHYELAALCSTEPVDKGPFYHGTRACMQVGDLLTPGFGSNYLPDLTMNHIYFTALLTGAGLAAALAKGNGSERVYMVEPTGSFEHDPNVTNKKFPGNPTRSYRTAAALKITGEVKDWPRTSPEDLRKWRGKLADNKGEIIN